MTLPRGMFISFEGTEGGGKSTQIQRLKNRLEALGKSVTTLREPGGTGLGELLRDILKTPRDGVEISPVAELLLMNASRAQLVAQVIEPLLNKGEIVLVDRFFDSTTVYQGYGRGLNLEVVKKTIEVAVGNHIPDLTFLLNVPVDVSESRRALRDKDGSGTKDRFEASERTFFERIEKGYKAVAEQSPDRIKVIDATQGIDAVHEAIWAELPETIRQK